MSFQSCRIVCKGANPLDYFRQEAERGTPEFVVSSSALREFRHCGTRWRAGYESPESASKRHGSLFDCLLLTPEQFTKRYAVQPLTYAAQGMECPTCKSVTAAKSCAACKCQRVPVVIEKDWNSNAEPCAAWKAEQEKAHLEVCKAADVAQADEAVTRLLADEIIGAWHAACDKQVWVAGEWKDDATGLVIPCRCLIDYVPRADTEFAKCAGDLKTTRSAAVGPFERFARQQGYHIQGAWNLDMLAAATGEDRCQFCLILSENFPPWEPGRRFLTESLEQDGRLFYRDALARYAHALKTGKWKGYDDNVQAVQGWTPIDSDPRMQLFAAVDAFQAELDAAAEAESTGDGFTNPNHDPDDPIP